MAYCTYCGQSMGIKKNCPKCGRAKKKSGSPLTLPLVILALLVGFLMGIYAGGFRPDLSSPGAALGSFITFMTQQAPLPTIPDQPTAPPQPAQSTATPGTVQGGDLVEVPGLPGTK